MRLDLTLTIVMATVISFRSVTEYPCLDQGVGRRQLSATLATCMRVGTVWVIVGDCRRGQIGRLSVGGASVGRTPRAHREQRRVVAVPGDVAKW